MPNFGPPDHDPRFDHNIDGWGPSRDDDDPLDRLFQSADGEWDWQLPTRRYLRPRCKFCGASDVIWSDQPQGPRLVNSDGSLHNCRVSNPSPDMFDNLDE